MPPSEPWRLARIEEPRHVGGLLRPVAVPQDAQRGDEVVVSVHPQVHDGPVMSLAHHESGAALVIGLAAGRQPGLQGADQASGPPGAAMKAATMATGTASVARSFPLETPSGPAARAATGMPASPRWKAARPCRTSSLTWRCSGAVACSSAAGAARRQRRAHGAAASA